MVTNRESKLSDKRWASRLDNREQGKIDSGDKVKGCQMVRAGRTIRRGADRGKKGLLDEGESKRVIGLEDKMEGCQMALLKADKY